MSQRRHDDGSHLPAAKNVLEPKRVLVPGRNTEPLLLDSREVSELLGIGRTKVFEMMARAELPVVRIGRCVRVPRVALARWLEDNTQLRGSATPNRTGRTALIGLSLDR
jgi:excisionase family DNA binding protein